MNLFHWPHLKVVIEPQFTWSLLIITANQPLSLVYRFVLAIIAFINALWIVSEMQSWQKLPILLGAIMVYGMLHYHLYVQKEQGNNFLAGSFCYYASHKMLSMHTSPTYLIKGGYNILCIGFFGCWFGCCWKFCQETEFKNALEMLVAKHAKEI